MANKIERKLHKFNASEQPLGRMASKIAVILRGKNKPEYEPNVDCGDIVEVSDIDKIVLTGKKIEQKKYFSYSGYPGGLKTKKIKDVLENNPADVLRRAVTDMLPHSRIRNNMMKRLIIK